MPSSDSWTNKYSYLFQDNDYVRKLTERSVWDWKDYRIAAGILRLADAGQGSPEFTKKFDEFDSVQKDHTFGFEIAHNLLQYTYDDSGDWELPELSRKRKEWCVDQVLGKLKEINDFDSEEGKRVLWKVSSIMSRTNTETTLSGEPETFVSEEDMKPVEDFLDSRPELRAKMEERVMEEIRKAKEAVEKQKNGQD